MNKKLIHPVDEKYISFLSDESKQEGFADTISFPSSPEELLQIIASPLPAPITFQGANTGVEGGSVPQGGSIINFSRMNHIREIQKLSDTEGYAVVEAGVTLDQLAQEIRRSLKTDDYIWPPSPTESSATVGGVIATGAYGMTSCYYGTTNLYLRELTLLHSNGHTEVLSDIPEHFQLPAGTCIVKATLKLLKRPANICGAAFFFDTESNALACADKLQNYIPDNKDVLIISMEYIGNTAIKMINTSRELISVLKDVPALPSDAKAVIYVEIAGNEESQDEALMELIDITSEYGSDPDVAWALTGYTEIRKMHSLRHAATESVIQFIERKHHEDNRIIRLGVKPLSRGRSFQETILSIIQALEDAHLCASIYAHIKNSDIQVNFLPENFEDYQKSKNIANTWI